MRTTRVRIKDRGIDWLVPYGFGEAYKGALVELGPAPRSSEEATALAGLGRIVGIELGIFGRSLPLREACDFWIWAGAEQLRASGIPAPRAPRPAWVPQAWQGAAGGAGASTGPDPTVLVAEPWLSEEHGGPRPGDSYPRLVPLVPCVGAFADALVYLVEVSPETWADCNDRGRTWIVDAKVHPTPSSARAQIERIHKARRGQA